MEKNSANDVSDTKQHLFFTANPSLWAAVEGHIHEKNYKKNEAIVHHGDAASVLWLITKGWVKLTRQTPDGKETIVGLCHEGELFGEAALFAHANYPYNAEVIGEGAHLASVPSHKVLELIQKNPDIASSIMNLLGERASQAQLKLEHMSTMSATQRLGCFLLRLCDHYTGNATTLQIPVEKYLLASYLGMKPETLSRSQAQLKSIGVEVHGSQVNISNISKLREFVCNSCSESGACEAELRND